MQNNITRADRLAASNFFLEGGTADLSDSRLTNGPQVEKFEEEFSVWLGSKYAVMVNSGSSANLLSMQALRIMHGRGRVLVPCITWVSDIAAVLHAGLDPVFVDVDPQTLGMDMHAAASHSTMAAFVTHCLGFASIKDWHAPAILVEDCCEALGAQVDGRKLGTIGLMSNFSFYYAHHMSTIEGGMICTDDERVYEMLRMLRAHGLVREMKNPAYRQAAQEVNPDLDPQFIFTHPAYNMRPIEVQAVIGRQQLKRVDYGNAKRTANLVTFLASLDSTRYRTQYRLEGSSNYALPLVLCEPDETLMGRVLGLLQELGVEYRRGTAGGGNQLRQPYARERWADFYQAFPQAEHIHHFGLYVGNFPDLKEEKITALCEALNGL